MRDLTREYMLDVLWKTIDHSRDLLHRFYDGTEAVYFRKLKIEKSKDGIELFDTSSEAYRIVPTYALKYAYDNGLRSLSDCYVFTEIEARLQKESVHAETRKTLTNKLSTVEGAINLNLIQENYESKQREDCEAVQEV